jgi:hypothetical protein
VRHPLFPLATHSRPHSDEDTLPSMWVEFELVDGTVFRATMLTVDLLSIGARGYEIQLWFSSRKGQATVPFFLFRSAVRSAAVLAVVHPPLPSIAKSAAWRSPQR